MSTIPKYEKLANARYELVLYLNTLNNHHPTRSIIERAIRDIDKIMTNNPTIRACTPKKGYVEIRLKETGKYNENPNQNGLMGIFD